MDIKFKVDSELKQEFLNMKPTATAYAESFVLRLADEFEYMIGKPIYNMSFDELDELIGTKFRNSSVKAVMKNVSILKTYIDFCIGKKVVVHGENRLATFTSKEAKKFVHRQALLNSFIDKETLALYEEMLYNEQDKLLLRLPYIGVKGRAAREGSFEEIINLRIDDLDEVNKMLTLRQNDGKCRRIKVDTHTIELIKSTYNQEFYVENNGEEKSNPKNPEPRHLVINKFDNYVLRVPGTNKFEKFSPNLLNSRMTRIQKYVGNEYLSYTNLYNSGMVQMAIDIYKEKGEVTKEDFILICDRFKYGARNSERYWFFVRDLFEQYRDLLNL